MKTKAIQRAGTKGHRKAEDSELIAKIKQLVSKDEDAPRAKVLAAIRKSGVAVAGSRFRELFVKATKKPGRPKGTGKRQVA